MTVGVREVEGDGGRRLRGATADLRALELDPIREVDADAMLSPRRGAADRTGRGVKHVRNHHTRGTTLDVHLELDAFEQRGMDGARHHPIDPPVGRPLVGLATVQDGRKRVSLLAVRSLIDDGLTLAVALVDRSRPGVEERAAQAIERHVSKVALLDPNGREAAAVSVCRPGQVELARTGVVAVAIAELDSFNVPVNLCHLGSSFRILHSSRTILPRKLRATGPTASAHAN